MGTWSVYNHIARRSPLFPNRLGSILGMNPRERGEPLLIQITSYSDLAEAVQKAACIQVMYNRDELQKSPMSAPIDPD